MSFKYPEARRDESVKDDYFGVQIADPYRWLEDPDSKETQEFVQTQNEITKPYLNGCAYKDKIKDKVTQLWNYPKYSIPFRHGNKYYQYRNSGLQNQSVIFVQESLKDEAKVFLDPNTFSEDGTVALSGTAFSEDGKTFAYGLSASGSDWIEIKFKNVQTGKDYDEVLKKVKYSPMTWMHDNKGFFYGAYLDQTGKADGSETKSNKNQKLYYHQLGTDQSKDIMAVEFDDEQLRMGAHVSHCGNYLIVTPIKGCKNNLLYFTKFQPDKTVTKKLELTPIVTEFNADYEYVTNTGTKFVFLTNKNAPNSRLIVIDIENYAELNWVDLVKEHPKDVLHWAHIINNNMLVLCYLKDVKGLVKDGSKCCLLYGYGGFNINLTPFFGVSSIIFINNFDGVFALANIRGGGEYGEKWHNGGRFDKKQNCFDDFQYAAKYLVNEKYTSVNKLTIQGGSNGGLLVAACVNQAPDLFGAAICQVGVLDMLRYHKFTIGYAWTSDYGSSEEEEQFRYLIKYSPLHSIQIPKEGSQYPATLLLTADHDDRVVPLHSLKFIAELQNKVGKLPQQKNPLMVRIETKAGHGAGKPTSKLIEEVTDYYCFISRALNLKFLD